MILMGHGELNLTISLGLLLCDHKLAQSIEKSATRLEVLQEQAPVGIRPTSLSIHLRESISSAVSFGARLSGYTDEALSQRPAFASASERRSKLKELEEQECCLPYWSLRS